MPATLPEPLLRVHQAIDEAVNALKVRQEALAALIDNDALQAETRDHELVNIHSRLRLLGDRSHKIDAILNDADHAISGSEQELAAYLERVRQMRQRLAEWAGRAIK